MGYFVLLIARSVRSMSADRDRKTSSSSLSGRASMASLARLACSSASCRAFSIPLLFPKYSKAYSMFDMLLEQNSYEPLQAR